jgi:hypothetical protein
MHGCNGYNRGRTSARLYSLKASSRPDDILFLPSTVCSSRVTTRNSDIQQLAKHNGYNGNIGE